MVNPIPAAHQHVSTVTLSMMHVSIMTLAFTSTLLSHCVRPQKAASMNGDSSNHSEYNKEFSPS